MALLMIALLAVVLKPAVNVHSQPTEEADVVSQATYGVNVGIVETRDGWAKIRTPDDYTGWTPLSALDRREQPYAASGTIAQVESLFAHVYREPDLTKHQPIVTVPFETRLEVTGPAANPGRWLPVRLADGRSGWVQNGDMTLNPQKLSIPEMIALSKRFIGLPYTWGGTSSFGYDCSGFTQMLCRRLGYLLPRDAAPQARWEGVKPVDSKSLGPGDLLYFGPSAEKITHTGLYIGEGKFIHATAHLTPVVQISELSDPHWTRLLVACRRLK